MSFWNESPARDVPLFEGSDRLSFALWRNQGDFAEAVNGVIEDQALQEGKSVGCLGFAGVIFIRRRTPAVAGPLQ